MDNWRVCQDIIIHTFDIYNIEQNISDVIVTRTSSIIQAPKGHPNTNREDAQSADHQDPHRNQFEAD